MEQSFVAWAKMRAKRLPAVKLGIGDDAAVLAADGRDIVITQDTLMDSTHFLLADVSPRRIGRKAVNVNLSDIAAMGAKAEAIFLTLVLPNNPVGMQTDELAAELYEGVCEACEKFNVALAGGDTNCWDGPLVIQVTATGRVQDDIVWRRDGAQPDDLIVVTGPLGGSIAGKHLDFLPRLDIVESIRGKVLVHAAMDISDGLSVDLLRMCDASHCGAILELDRVPITEAAHAASTVSGKAPVEHALGDGEDFELLLTIAPTEYGKLCGIIGSNQSHVVGTITSRTGLWAKESGKIRQLTSSGYIHGR